MMKPSHHLYLLCSTLLLILLSCFFYLIRGNFDAIQERWEQYSKVEANIMSSAHVLSNEMGYGGMIHAFKNYVIRGSSHYEQIAYKSIMSVETQIDLLTKLPLTASELDSLKVIRNVVNEYRNNIPVVRDLHAQNVEIEAIDERVRVDDQEALRALNYWRLRMIDNSNEIISETLNLNQKADQHVIFTISLLTLMILLLFIASIYLSRWESKKQLEIKNMQWSDNILSSVPDAMLIVDDAGNIIRTNKVACSLFGYNYDEFAELDIEQLMPEKHRAIHKRNREVYFQNPSNINMNRQRDLFAQTKEGAVVPVEIQINSAQFDAKRFAILTIRDITQRKKTEEKINYQAHYDLLTGLPNRFSSMEKLAYAIEQAKRDTQQLAVLFIDLDNFKLINDSLGHEAGDQLLIDFTHRLKKVFRRNDAIGRIGGDEFIAILNNVHKDSVTSISSTILHLCEDLYTIQDKTLSVTVSIGGAIYPDDAGCVSSLLRHADMAMYEAKRMGRNKFKFYDQGMNLALNRQMTLEENIGIADISSAINLSPMEIRDKDLINQFLDHVKEYVKEGFKLEVEITEGMLLENNLHTREFLHELNQLGIKITMDDFGTGYSSLSYLRQYPFDVVKIDKSFITKISK